MWRHAKPVLQLALYRHACVRDIVTDRGVGRVIDAVVVAGPVDEAVEVNVEVVTVEDAAVVESSPDDGDVVAKKHDWYCV